MSDDVRRRPDEVAHRDHEVPDTTSGFDHGPRPGTVADEIPQGGVVPHDEGGLWSDAWRQLRRNPMFIIPLLLIIILTLMAARPSLFTDANPLSCSLSRSLQPPGPDHVFGTDLQGCDYFARTVYGAKVSMSVGVLSTFFATMIAMLLGSISGYYGRLTDTIIARITDIWFAIPTILGGIVILSVFQRRGIATVSIVLIVLSWPTMMRLMRSSVLSAKEMDYVAAARALGAGDIRIMRRHIFPNAIAPVIVYATILVGISISAEAALSFLNVGIQLPAISWGLMINTAQTRILEHPHLLLFPGLFLSVAIFSFILMGDALRDALDPKLR
jgi:ABC-type dipeptide/oligopeptide/nickel transport system permease subunit